MGNTRTIAFQVPEEMYQRIKDYLHRHHMTQKEFFLGLISAELDRDMQISGTQAASDNQENNSEDINDDNEESEEYGEDNSESEDVDEDFSEESEESEGYSEDESESEDNSEEINSESEEESEGYGEDESEIEDDTEEYAEDESVSMGM